MTTARNTNPWRRRPLDLEFSEIVGGGQYIVGALLPPEAIFTGSPALANWAAPRSSQVPASAVA